MSRSIDHVVGRMGELEDLQRSAERLASMGYADPGDKLRGALDLLSNDWVLDYQGYDDWLRSAGEALERLQIPVGVAFTYLARGDRGRALEHLSASEAPVARAFVVEGRDPAEAASLYLQQGCFARAAQAWERARAPERAIEAWRRALDAYPATDPGRHALAHLGLGHALLLAEREGARQAIDEGLMWLARDAVEAETAGDLPGAIDRYQTMAEVGDATQQVEHVLEGAVNEARLHEAQGDRDGAFLARAFAAAACESAGEHRAAAALYQEAARAAEGARPSHVDACWARAADAWWAAAARIDALSPALAENALLARLDALNRCDAGAGALAETYEALAALGLSPATRDRYAQLAKSLDPSAFERGQRARPPLPARESSGRHWAAALFDHELGTSPLYALLECTARADSIIARRRATRALLALLAFPGDPDCHALAAVTLGPNVAVASTEPVLLSYATHASADVRAAAVRGLSTRRGTRVANALVHALTDADFGVQMAAGESLGATGRGEAIGPAVRRAIEGPRSAALAVVGWLGAWTDDAALDPLFRIAQRATDEDVRAAAASRFERRCPVERRDLYVGR